MVEEIDEDYLLSANISEKPIILIIEDNFDMRTYIKSILSNEYNILLATDGEKGIEKARTFKPALIISDILMPQKDGYEVCKTLKSSKATDYIPIILLTACSFDDQRAKGYECGADAYIQKPFNVNVLKTRISKLLERNKAISAAIKGDWLIGFDADRSDSSSVTLLEKIRAYVEENINDEINLDELSVYLGMSKSKLYRELKAVTEYSPIDLANMIKLKKAIDLIIYKNYNISQAAFNSGFSSSAYFSRLFKKFYHETPSDYVNRFINKQNENNQNIT